MSYIVKGDDGRYLAPRGDRTANSERARLFQTYDDAKAATIEETDSVVATEDDNEFAVK